MFFLLVTLAISGVLVNCQIDTSKCTDYNTDVKKCKNDFDVPDYNANINSIKEFYKLKTDKICNKNYVDLVGCMIDAYRACAEMEREKLVATSEQYKSSISKVCDNKDDYDGSCVTGPVEACIAKGNQNLTKPNAQSEYADVKMYYCAQDDIRSQCIAAGENFKECGKNKTAMVLAEVLDELKLTVCGATPASTYTTVLVLASLFVYSIL